MVRIHPDPPKSTWGCSSIGRAPALQAGGRRFDPVQLHQLSPSRLRAGTVFSAAHAVRNAEGSSLFNNSEGKGSLDLMRVRRAKG